MRLLVLGSGTLLPNPDRGSPGYWLESGEDRILMDCGSGTLRSLARMGIEWQRVTHLLISHFHTDHVADIAPLLFALKHGTGGSRTLPLTVLGPPGVKDHLHALARAHGGFVLDPGFPLEVEELGPGIHWMPAERTFRLSSHPTIHSDPSLAYRLEADFGAVGYTGDTGPDPSLGPFLSGCQLLVAECSNPDGAGAGNHLEPSTLSELASQATPELLVTVHAYPPLRPEEVPDLLRGWGYEGRVIAGWDGLAVKLRDGALEGWSSSP